MNDNHFIKDSKYGLSNQAIKSIFRKFYREGKDTFTIHKEINLEFRKNISKNDIAKILNSKLSKLYNEINCKNLNTKKINEDLLNTRNKERESNKDLFGDSGLR